MMRPGNFYIKEKGVPPRPIMVSQPSARECRASTPNAQTLKTVQGSGISVKKSLERLIEKSSNKKSEKENQVSEFKVNNY